jgi:hypothetical protein
MASTIPPPPPPPTTTTTTTTTVPPLKSSLPHPTQVMTTERFSDEFRQTIQTACSNVEVARQQRTEREAWEVFASSQLLHYQQQQQKAHHPDNKKRPSTSSSSLMTATTTTTTVVDTNPLPVSVQEAWKALVREATHPMDQLATATTAAIATTSSVQPHDPNKKADSDESSAHHTILQIPSGQQSIAVTTVCTANSLKRMAMMAQTVTTHDRLSNKLLPSSSSLDPSATTPGAWLTYMDERLQEIRKYHAEHDNHSILIQLQQQQQQPQPPQSTQQAALSRRYTLPTDLACHVTTWSRNLETDFRTQEVLGKYLDLQDIFETLSKDLPNLMKHLTDTNANQNQKSSSSYQYVDFLEDLSKRGLGIMFSEDIKLCHGGGRRRKYVRWCTELWEYLYSFIARTVPLLDIPTEILQPAHRIFVETWARHGGNATWQSKPAEAALALTIPDYTTNNKNSTTTNNNNGTNNHMDSTKENDKASENPHVSSTAATPSINLNEFETAEELSKAIDGDKLKAELSLLGLKCGGTVLDRAKRLFLLKTQKLEDLPAKLFVQKRSTTTTTPITTTATATVTESATTTTTNSQDGLGPRNGWISTKLERRIDIAYREAMIAALLDQVRPTLEATIRRLERQLTQTLKEREREMEEELYGSSRGGLLARKNNLNQGDGETAGDSDEDDDAPVFYNPKNVPLDWDGELLLCEAWCFGNASCLLTHAFSYTGKPIPYWLFKLHGLNHYYPCEICGGESYRGRRAFELHFAEQKHVAGMAALGIPNTKHFHGVTKIEDAQELWSSLQEKLRRDQFDGIQEEEFEDSHGNVLSRAAYEDLARQGLL